jgi:hypothetical protein
MRSNSKFYTNIEIPIEIRLLLGNPPVLRTEIEKHQDIFWHFAQSVKPRDIFEWIYIRDLADVRVEIQRLRRLSARLIGRPCKKNGSKLLQAICDDGNTRINKIAHTLEKDWQAELEKNKYPADQIKDQVAKFNQKTKAKIRKIHREAKEQEATLKQTYTESDYQAEVFAEWIEAYERVQLLLTAAEKRFREFINDLDEHRRGLGEWLCRANAQIIDHEPDENSILDEGPTLGEESAAPAAPSPTADPAAAAGSPSAVHSAHEQDSMSGSPTTACSACADRVYRYPENRMNSSDEIGGNPHGARTSGPKTAHGKAVSRQNALRHGLASKALRAPLVATRAESIAWAIVQYGGQAMQYDQALAFAECQATLLRVRNARLAAIERAMLPALRRDALPGQQTTEETEGIDGLLLAVAELLPLERYERREFARRRQAMRMLSRQILDASLTKEGPYGK